MQQCVIPSNKADSAYCRSTAKHLERGEREREDLIVSYFISESNIYYYYHYYPSARARLAAS